MRPLLIAEDNPHDLHLMQEAIGRLSLPNRIDVVRDGAQALDYLRTAARRAACPALVLLDIKLPRASGHDVLRDTRRRRCFCQMPIVMISASNAPSDVRSAYDLGANGYVIKPLSFRELIEAVAITVGFWIDRNVPPPMRAGAH